MARSPLRRALVLGAVAALAVPVAAQARDMYVTDTAGNLHRLDDRHPGVVLDTVPVTGLPAGVGIQGIDFRPATGDLVAVGSDSRLYVVDPGTGAATVSGGPFTPGLVGTAFGVDVNPVPDALRITSDAEQNYRIAFATGQHGAGSPDGALNPGDPSIVGSAYTNSTLTATRPATTTLYGIDAAANTLVVQDPPNAGALGAARPLGVDVTERTGFDIAGAGNMGYLATTPAGRDGATLYRVDLATGALTERGPIATGSLLRTGTSRVNVTGLAARQEVSAPRVNVAPWVRIEKTTQVPRPGQRAAYIAQAADPDGDITRVEWDTDGDGAFDDARSTAIRLGLPAGVRTLRVRVTDSSGARAVAATRVVVRR